MVLPIARVIAESGHCLKLPRETVSIALYYFHKMCFSAKGETNSDLFAASVLLLASKVAETPQSLRDVLNIVQSICDRLKGEGISLSMKRLIQMPEKLDERYNTLKSRLVTSELKVLEWLQFDVEPPKTPTELLRMTTILKVSNCTIGLSWIVLNDAYLDQCCLANDNVLSASALFVALQLLTREEASDNDVKCKEIMWWKQFNVTTDEIEQLSGKLLQLINYDTTS